MPIQLLNADRKKTVGQAWNDALKNAPKGTRIASMADLALGRIQSPAPHTPDKPWEVYQDGTAPFWQFPIASQTTFMIGLNRDKNPIALLVPSYTIPKVQCIEQNSKGFRISHFEWERLCQETPASHQFPLISDDGLWSVLPKFHPSLRPSELQESPFFKALFGEQLIPYAEVHGRIAAEFIWHRLSHNRVLESIPPEGKIFMKDPPIVRWSPYHRPTDFQGPGAKCIYLGFEPVIREHFNGLGRWGETRLSEIDDLGPEEKMLTAIVTPD